MGFFDSAQDLLTRGMAATERGTRTLSLKTQLGDANKQRDRALAALGESLYGATKDNAEMRAGREELYRAVADADARREDIERQIAEVEEQSAAARVAATGARPCPRCGATVAAEHKFCAACGAEVPPIVAPVEPAATDAAADPVAVAVEAVPVEPAAAADAAATTDETTTADVK